MKTQDENIRNAVNDALTRKGIDVRNLFIESFDGRLVISGSLPSIEQQDVLIEALKIRFDGVHSLECDVSLKKVAASDSDDGRGRSPLTGTSSDSGHESRHQLDRD